MITNDESPTGQEIMKDEEMKEQTETKTETEEKQTKEKKSKQRKPLNKKKVSIIVCVIAVVIAAGCGIGYKIYWNKMEAKYIGSWEVNYAEYYDPDDKGSYSDDGFDVFKDDGSDYTSYSLWGSKVEDFTLHIREDHTLTIVTGKGIENTKVNGTWKLIRRDGKVILKMKTKEDDYGLELKKYAYILDGALIYNVEDENDNKITLMLEQ